MREWPEPIRWSELHSRVRVDGPLFRCPIPAESCRHSWLSRCAERGMKKRRNIRLIGTRHGCNVADLFLQPVKQQLVGLKGIVIYGYRSGPDPQGSTCNP